MKQNEKELLLKDLCARLPYGVICHYDTIVPMVGKVKSYGRLYNISFFDVKPCFQFHCNRDVFDFDNVKPYLFPLSSMTKEQKKELENLGWNFDNFEIHNVSECLGTYREYVAHSDCLNLIDWLNKNHFDYRNLIDKNLAIDCTNLNIY